MNDEVDADSVPVMELDDGRCDASYCTVRNQLDRRLDLPRIWMTAAAMCAIAVDRDEEEEEEEEEEPVGEMEDDDDDDEVLIEDAEETGRRRRFLCCCFRVGAER